MGKSVSLNATSSRSRCAAHAPRRTRRSCAAGSQATPSTSICRCDSAPATTSSLTRRLLQAQVMRICFADLENQVEVVVGLLDLVDVHDREPGIVALPLRAGPGTRTGCRTDRRCNRRCAGCRPTAGGRGARSYGNRAAPGARRRRRGRAASTFRRSGSVLMQQADHRLDLRHLVRRPDAHAAEHHVVAAAVALQHHAPEHLQHRVQRHAELARECQQTRGARGVDAGVVGLVQIAARRRFAALGHDRSAFAAGQVVLPELQRSGFVARLDPADVVLVRRGTEQRGAAAAGEQILVDALQLVDQQVDAPAVDDDVMEREHQAMAVVAELNSAARNSTSLSSAKRS